MPDLYARLEKEDLHEYSIVTIIKAVVSCKGLTPIAEGEFKRSGIVPEAAKIAIYEAYVFFRIGDEKSGYELSYFPTKIEKDRIRFDIRNPHKSVTPNPALINMFEKARKAKGNYILMGDNELEKVIESFTLSL